jgi:hypothetical protein
LQAIASFILAATVTTVAAQQTALPYFNEWWENRTALEALHTEFSRGRFVNIQNALQPDLAESLFTEMQGAKHWQYREGYEDNYQFRGYSVMDPEIENPKLYPEVNKLWDYLNRGESCAVDMEPYSLLTAMNTAACHQMMCAGSCLRPAPARSQGPSTASSRGCAPATTRRHTPTCTTMSRLRSTRAATAEQWRSCCT